MLSITLKSRTMTVAQAMIEFLNNQYVRRDGVETQLFAGCFGIFGHGNLAGFGQALQEHRQTHGENGIRFIPARNEQAMVHAATAYAREKRRLQTWICTSSVGPGATNMVTGAATATINRLPVLLLPGDTFATRRVDPVLQQLEHPASPSITVNDAFIPVSRYWDRIQRPEQFFSACLNAVRVLVDPAQTGAVTIAVPQDVQAEQLDVPESFLRRRVWNIDRTLAPERAIAEVVELLQGAQRPLIVAGGGVIYSDAEQQLADFAQAYGIPVCETQAGKGSLAWSHPLNVGAVGATGGQAANVIARDADVVIGIGTRWSDFTTASQSAFQHPDVKFICCNVDPSDAAKQGAIPLVGDARAVIGQLAGALRDWRVPDSLLHQIRSLKVDWNSEVTAIYDGSTRRSDDVNSQGEVIGVVEEAVGANGVVLCAAGSLPGDLHKLWRAAGAHSYHVEYGYSCMGYEVAGALGAALADPSRRVITMVGDGSWLMMSSEIVTAVQEGVAFTVVLIDNSGYASIGALSESLGSGGFGTHQHVPVDFVAQAQSMGAVAVKAATVDELRGLLAQSPDPTRPSVFVIDCDRESRVGGYESWWEVPVAQVSAMEEVKESRAAQDIARKLQRQFL